MLNRLFDTSKINSLANKFRRKRFRIILYLNRVGFMSDFDSYIFSKKDDVDIKKKVDEVLTEKNKGKPKQVF